MKNVVIIPTYNEKENIETVISRIFTLVPDISVTVVDDNSPDGTATIVESLMRKYPQLAIIKRQKKEGLGKAYICAFRKILEDNDVRSIIMMDADLSHDPAVLPEMLAYSEEYDVVIGSRYVRSGGTEGWELWRRGLSFFANIYCRMITRLPVYDCTGGYNLVSVSLLRKIDFSTMDSSGYAFQMELKFMLWKAGARFKEIPIIFKNRANGESKISSHIILEGVRAPWNMVYYSE